VTSPNHAKSAILDQSSLSSMRSVLRGIFMTEEGIRSGWSALFFIAFYIAITTLTDRALSRFMQLDAQGPLAPSLVFIEEACSLLAILIAILIMARIERRPILSFGYSDGQFARRLGAGAFCGCLSLTCLIGILWKAHLLVFGGLSIRGMPAWKDAFAWALTALLVGIVEESLLRGYLQFTLARALGFWWAAFLLSLAFARRDRSVDVGLVGPKTECGLLSGTLLSERYLERWLLHPSPAPTRKSNRRISVASGESLLRWADACKHSSACLL
jgi:membrane protease YdiL (CAAX protease family)